jgi:DNA polymerase III delta subunit
MNATPRGGASGAGDRSARRAEPGTAPVGYFWGEDAYGIDRAVGAFRQALAGSGEPHEVWRAPSDDEVAAEGTESGSAAKRRSRTIDEIESRLAAMPLFGGGTLVVIRQPGGLLRENAARDRLVWIVANVPSGNGLAISDLVGADAKGPAASGVLRDAVADAGGTVREYPALTRERMEAWLASRAAELGVRLGPGAGRLLAERIGAFVREADVDRRRQSELANSELEKLALYRPSGTVSRDDVAELVAEAIPGSTWAFLDALGSRRAGEASRLAERLMDGGAPLPVLVGQCHRRLRELLMVRDHMDAGTRPADLAKQMRLQPFRAQKLAEQAGTWTSSRLTAAISGLVELDLRSKGITLDGSTAQMSESRDALGLQLWLAEQVAAR